MFILESEQLQSLDGRQVTLIWCLHTHNGEHRCLSQSTAVCRQSDDTVIQAALLLLGRFYSKFVRRSAAHYDFELPPRLFFSLSISKPFRHNWEANLFKSFPQITSRSEGHSSGLRVAESFQNLTNFLRDTIIATQAWKQSLSLIRYLSKRLQPYDCSLPRFTRRRRGDVFQQKNSTWKLWSIC